jgi:hypothetical protein
MLLRVQHGIPASLCRRGVQRLIALCLTTPVALAVLADPQMTAQITDYGYTVFESSPAEFSRFIAEYTEKWAKVIRFSGAKVC